MNTKKQRVPNFPDFKKLELEDKDEIESIVKQFDPYSDYNFVSLFSYDVDEEVQISKLNGNLIVRFSDYVSSELFYSFLGNNSLENTIHTLLKHSEVSGLTPKLKLIPEVNFLEKKIFNAFFIEEDRDNFDYLLSTEEISKLNGRKYEKKRNKINTFLKSNSNIKSALIDLKDSATHTQIYEVFSLWEKTKGKEGSETIHELKAIKKLLSNIHYFNVLCLGIYIDGIIKGFTITEISHNNVAIFHFTKADSSFKGIFEYIYQQIAQELFKKGSIFLNREQDLGLPGLRAAKKSWRPIKYLKKYTISPKTKVPTKLSSP